MRGGRDGETVEIMYDDIKKRNRKRDFSGSRLFARISRVRKPPRQPPCVHERMNERQKPIKTERSLHNMDEEFKVIDNYLMIRLPDEIDHHKSVDISAKADRYIVSKKVGNVVFDFERTTFMDSSGIGIILGRYKKISCFGGRVYAVNVDSRIRRILLLSGLQNIVEIME